MTPRKVGAGELGEAVGAVLPWLAGEGEEPGRAVLGRAVRVSLRMLAQLAPGATVEVRVPPSGAVQCVSGPRHTRGTPPNVVETDPRTWLELATGRIEWAQAFSAGRVMAAGIVVDVARLLLMVRGLCREPTT